MSEQRQQEESEMVENSEEECELQRSRWPRRMETRPQGSARSWKRR